MKKLTVLFGLCTLLLAACAADPEDSIGNESEGDLETVEQAFGEAACETVSPSAPNGGRTYTLSTGIPSCAQNTSPTQLYSNPGCSQSYIVNVVKLAAGTASAQVSDTNAVDLFPQNECEQTVLKATLYRPGYAPVALSRTGFWQTWPSIGCRLDPLDFGSFATPAGGWRIVAQSQRTIPGSPFPMISPRYVTIATGTSSTCAPL